MNTTVWYNDADDKAPIWCDISVKVSTDGHGLNGEETALNFIARAARYRPTDGSRRSSLLYRPLSRRHR